MNFDGIDWFFHILLALAWPMVSVEQDEQQLTNGCGGITGYEACTCSIYDRHSVKADCRRMPWRQLSIPPLPEKGYGMKIINLTIYDTRVAKLEGNTFVGSDIASINIVNCQLNSIKYGAFNGLELNLVSLTLDRNRLTSITKTIQRLSVLSHLSVSNNRISTIDDFKFMGKTLDGLKTLFLANNLIRDISFGTFATAPQLGTIVLTGNKIRSIKNGSFPSTLRILRLDNNLLSKIPFGALSSCPDLNDLSLASNNIQGLDPISAELFSMRDETASVNLNANRIRKLRANSFQNFPVLYKLSLQSNLLTEISSTAFSGIIQVIEIDLSNNNIQSIDVDAFKELSNVLQVLKLGRNAITIIPSDYKNFKVMTHFNVESNRLRQIDSRVFGDRRQTLRMVNLRDNDLTRVPTAALNGMREMLTLDISENYIRHLEAFPFGIDTHKAKKLFNLNLNGNGIEILDNPKSFLYLQNLEKLNMERNKLIRVEPIVFVPLVNLRYLFLSHNSIRRIDSVPVHHLPKLSKLALQFNQIREIPENSFRRSLLITLDLSNNQIGSINNRSFAADQFPTLKRLHLSGNRLTNLDAGTFRNFKSLVLLELATNKLSTIQSEAFSNMDLLEMIDLKANFLTSLPNRTFHELKRLRILDLRYNRMTSLSSGLMHECYTLEHLNLAHNQFDQIDLSVFQYSSGTLKTLDLSHNNLNYFTGLNHFRQQLEQINLQNNMLLVLPGSDEFAYFERLYVINIGHNSLKKLSPKTFLNSSTLVKIFINDNLLSSIPKKLFIHQDKLYLLDLSSNRISYIEEGAFGYGNLTIERMYLANNRLPLVPRALNALKKTLKVLDLSHNAISYLSSDQFDEFFFLGSLRLGFNKIHTLSNLTFSGLLWLHHLDIQSNPIRNLTESKAFSSHNNFFFLDELNLANTNILNTPNLRSLHLVKLNLSFNQIEEIRPELLSVSKDYSGNLDILDLSHNNIQRLPPHIKESDGMFTLTHLNVSYNNFTSLANNDLSELTKLESFSFCCMDNFNYVSPSAFEALPFLTDLRFHSFPILQKIEFSRMLLSLPSISRLHIETKATTLTSGDFVNLDCRLLRDIQIFAPNLEQVDSDIFRLLRGPDVYVAITNSKLSSMPAQFFQYLGNINHLHLDLRNNRIRTWDATLYHSMPQMNKHGTILKSLNLEGNYLTCDSDLNWIGDWFNYARLTEYHYFLLLERMWGSTYCTRPPLRRGKKAFNVLMYNASNSRSTNPFVGCIVTVLIHAAAFLMTSNSTVVISTPDV